jgi:hypothetical protein
MTSLNAARKAVANDLFNLCQSNGTKACDEQLSHTVRLLYRWLSDTAGTLAASLCPSPRVEVMSLRRVPFARFV